MSPGRLGLAILLGPVTWLVCLEADYALVPWACSRAEAGLAALCAVAAVALTAPPDGPPPESRGRFMALTALGSGGLFLLVALANTLPKLLLGPCE